MESFHRSVTGEQIRIQSGSQFHIITNYQEIRYVTFGTCISNLNNFTLIFRTRKQAGSTKDARKCLQNGKSK